jgi:hypothetical protein
MNELTNIYQILRSVGLCSSQAEFSRNWLGRSAHYMASIGGDANRASLTSLRLLASELELTVLIAKHSTDASTYRQIRNAWVAARTICDGVFELRNVPRYYRVTALFD